MISATQIGSRTIEAWSGLTQRQFRLLNPITSTVTPGPADPDRSTIALAPPQVTADGQNPITVTIVLSDSFGNRATDRPVALLINGSAITTTPAALTTDANGVAIGQVVSTRAQTVTVRAMDATFGVTLTAQPSAVFVPGPVSLDTSSLGIAPLQACADGYDPVTVTLNLLDAFNNGEPNRHIRFYAPGTTIAITPASAWTNVDGQAWTAISSRDVQSITVSAVNETDNLTLTHALPVSFVPCKTDPDRSSFTVSPNTLVADGTSVVNIVVTLRDAAYQPRVGHAVTLTLTGSDNRLQGPIPALTGDDGTVTLTLASMRVESKSITAIDLTDAITLTPRRAVTFTVGPIDPAASQLSTNQATLIADGVDYATLTATLYDSYNHPLSGKVVPLQTTGTSITLTQSVTTTNAQGRVQATVRSLDVQTATFTAFDETDGVTLTHEIPIGFVAGPAVAAHSNVVVTPDQVVADGVQSAAITVTLRDALDHPANNRLVRLTATGSHNSIAPSEGTTDVDGTIVFHLASTRAEAKQVSINDVTDGLTLDAGTITFEHGPFDPAVSTLSVSSTEAPNDGVSPITLTARILDAWSNPVPDANVTFAANTTGVAITQPISTTDGDGYASGSIVGTTMQPFTLTASADGLPLVASARLNFIGIDLTLGQNALGQVKVGRSLTYTLNVANEGLVTAPQVVLTDTLPAYMSFVTQTSPYSFAVTDGVVVWQLGDMAPDVHIQLTLQAYLSRTAPIGLDLTNQSTVRAHGYETDLSNNSSQWTTISAPRTPKLTVSPLATTLLVRAGDTTTFTVRVRNDGTDELTDVTAAPPPHMTWVQLGQTTFPELLPGQETSFVVTANVPSDLASGYYRDLIRFNSLEGGQQMIALTIQVQNAARDLVFRLNNIDGRPIPNAQIALNKSIYVVTEGNPSTQPASQLVSSNASGMITLTQQDIGTLGYSISAIGYQPLAGSLSVVEGADPQIVNLVMTANLGLDFTPASPQLNVVPGEGALIDMGVRSTSLITTYNISVTSPSAIAWVYLGRSGELDALEPGGTFSLTINAVPPVDTLPGVYIDTIGLHADGGLSVTLPFTVVISQDPYRTLQVTIQDTDDNPIVGAQLELVRQQSTFLISGTITNTVRETQIAQTDSNGQTLFVDLPLGVYNYYISANGYQAKTGSLEVKPGAGIQEETIRMPHPGLNVHWTVIPTTIQDIYTATLQLIFDPFAPEPTIGCGPLQECFKPQEALEVHNSYPVTIENAHINIKLRAVRFNIIPIWDRLVRTPQLRYPSHLSAAAAGTPPAPNRPPSKAE